MVIFEIHWNPAIAKRLVLTTYVDCFNSLGKVPSLVFVCQIYFVGYYSVGGILVWLCSHICVHLSTRIVFACMYVFVHKCQFAVGAILVCVYVYVFVHVCVYVYVFTHIVSAYLCACQNSTKTALPLCSDTSSIHTNCHELLPSYADSVQYPQL